MSYLKRYSRKLIETTNAELATVKEEIAKVQGDEVDTKLSVPIEGVNEQGVPIGENVPPPTKQSESNTALKDVESTTKALEEINYDENAIPYSLDYLPTDKKAIAEAYHADKVAGKDTVLTKAIESLLSKEQTPPALTKEAVDLLANVGEGNVSTFITKNLEKIAADNGIEITEKMTAVDVVNALKEKAKDSNVVGSGEEPSIVVHGTTNGYGLQYSEGKDAKDIVEPSDPRMGTMEQRIELNKGNAIVIKDEVNSDGGKDVSVNTPMTDSFGREGGAVYELSIPKGNKATAEGIKK